MKLGTSNCANYSTRNQSTVQGMSIIRDFGNCTCGHFLRKGTEENKKFVQYTMDLLSIPNYYIKKGRLHGHRYGKKPGDTENITSPIRSRRSAKRRISWVSTTDSSETKSSARTCLTPVELKKCVAKWTTWRTKTTRIT